MWHLIVPHRDPLEFLSLERCLRYIAGICDELDQIEIDHSRGVVYLTHFQIDKD